uniref:hypothetical protein n=1 Tax=Bacillus sp. JCM 19034 TaxID=1481928 RepID=UPI000A9A0787
MGDNGEDLVFDVYVRDTEYHAQRIWKVQNTKDVGNVQVALPEDAILDVKKLLVSDNDTDFSEATEYELEVSEINGISYFVANDVPLENGQYFTFSVFAPELTDASVEEVTVGEQEIVLTFDKPITLTDLDGLTVTIGDEELGIDSYKIDPDDDKILKLNPGTEIKPNDTVLVSYKKDTGNIKGLNGAPVRDFEMEAVNSIEATPLETPEVMLDENGVLKWEEITNADKYEVTIEVEDGEPIVVEVTEGTELDLTELELEPGTYTVSVVAKSDDSAYTDSEPSDSVTYTEPATALPAPVVELEDGVLTWEEIDNADKYEVTI